MSDEQVVDGPAPEVKKAVVGFDIGVANEVTYDIPFSFDGDGNTIAAITIVGKNSQQYKDADRRITRVALKKSSVRGRPLDLKKDSDSEEFLDTREATNIGLAVAVTVGWFGLTSGGEEFPFSADAAKTLYTANSVVLNKVLSAVEDQANFLKR